MCITNFIIHIKTVRFDLTQSSSAVAVYMYAFFFFLINSSVVGETIATHQFII